MKLKARKLAMPVVFSALVSGVFGAEFVLQNGANGYNGCEDATILSSTVFAAMNTEHYKKEYSDSEFDDMIKGDANRNFDNMPFLYVNFCPS